MKYFKYLINRSLLLWRTLFGVKDPSLTVPTVDIDETSAAAERYQIAAPEEIFGAADAAQEEKEPAFRKKAEQVFGDFESRAKFPEALKEEPADDEKKQPDPAARLLEKIRKAEIAEQTPSSRPPDGEKEREISEGDSPVEDWSDLLEQDARRYDGGYEWM